MKDFEQKLKTLEIRKPSENLDHRILSVKPEDVDQNYYSRRILLWAAVSVCLLIGVFGFMAGALWQANHLWIDQSEGSNTKMIYILPVSPDYFDTTQFSNVAFPETWETHTRIIENKSIQKGESL